MTHEDTGKVRVNLPPRRSTSCIIWPDYQADAIDRATGIFSYRSPRAGGWYQIAQETIDAVQARPAVIYMDVAQKLTTYLIDQWLLDKATTTITLDLIRQMEEVEFLSVPVRAERLLRYLAYETLSLGQYVHLKKTTEPVADTGKAHAQTLESLAWSESQNWEEVEFLLKYLHSRGWVEFPRNNRSAMNCIVTVEGYSKIEEVETRGDPAQCFVAMWFHESMDEVYKEGIKPAIEAAGYKPLRIDRKEDLLDKIDDAIIAEIRRSRFLVADFTHGKGGARGGVYYEAGFAKGLEIPVIYLCKKEMIDELHFDTRQINHIDWTTPDELRERLEVRILASLGEGPKLAAQ